MPARVQVLIDRTDADQLDPIGWQYQSDIHGTTVNPDNFRNRCQHFCWYFLPWHRMYLQWFERIIRSVIQDLDDVDEQTKTTWALPYWNYSSDDPVPQAVAAGVSRHHPAGRRDAESAVGARTTSQ